MSSVKHEMDAAKLRSDRAFCKQAVHRSSALINAIHHSSKRFRPASFSESIRRGSIYSVQILLQYDSSESAHEVSNQRNRSVRTKLWLKAKLSWPLQQAF
jgi:hypothetical protein